jgi:hypothetical protein
MQHRRLPSQTVRFGFEKGILDDGHPTAKRICHPTRSLLHHMHQLVSQKNLPMWSMRIVLTGREMDICSPRKRDCANRCRFRSDVNAHIGKAGTQDTLHLCLYFAGQRPASGARWQRDWECFDSDAQLDSRLRLDRLRFPQNRKPNLGPRPKKTLHHTRPATANSLRWRAAIGPK